jgi:hypothetical protein
MPRASLRSLPARSGRPNNRGMRAAPPPASPTRSARPRRRVPDNPKRTRPATPGRSGGGTAAPRAPRRTPRAAIRPQPPAARWQAVGPAATAAETRRMRRRRPRRPRWSDGRGPRASGEATR